MVSQPNRIFLYFLKIGYGNVTIQCFIKQYLLALFNLNLTAVGRSAHTFFKGLFLKKSLSAKNLQKIPIPRKMPAESKSRVKYRSKNVILCLFYASEQAKVPKKAT